MSDKAQKTAGIITFHDSYNMGACLQAYATLRLFERLGYQSFLINYKNGFEQGNKKLLYCPDGKPSTLLASLAKNILFKKQRCMKQSYEGRSRLYDVPDESYSSLSQLASIKADLLVAGSDQIWNPKITHGLDTAYLLDFGSSNIRRISFASSVGSYQYRVDELNRLIPLLERFDFVSVREATLRDQLTPRLKQDVHVVPDPTMMFDGSFWRDFYSSQPARKNFKAEDGSYGLAYFVGTGFENYYPAIRSYITEIGLPIMNVQFNTMKRRGVDEAIIGASPRDFVELIDHAAYVITDSFHGVAFSVNLGTPFIAMNNKSNPLRVQEFLSSCGLSHRIEPEDASGLFEPDLKQAQIVLSDKRKRAERLLVESLSSGEGK